MVFSGPIDLYQVAAYEAGDRSGYDRVAYWDPCTTEGLAFVGNRRGISATAMSELRDGRRQRQ